MSYESRAYDNNHGDPVVVLVVTGTHDVSRLVNLLAGNRMALCEHVGVSEQILRQVKRHNGGRAALELLAAHGGPDLRGDERQHAENESVTYRDALIRLHAAIEDGEEERIATVMDDTSQLLRSAGII